VTTLLYRIQHVLMISTGLALAVLTWFWSPAGAVMLLAAEAVLLAWAIRKGFFKVPEPRPTLLDGESGDQAKAMVTHLLKALTRVQVAYLCQDFKSRAEGRSWLKRALPKAFAKSLDDLHSKLEVARQGHAVPALRLAQRILTHREQILQLERDLEQAHEQNPDYEVAHPMIFVVTEHLDQPGGDDPGVVTLAGWNPELPTLLPEVDAVTFYSELDAGKKVRGQADFDSMLHAMPQNLRRVESESRIYAARPVEDSTRLGVRLDKVPLGFTVETGGSL
jgi:hypothetical protein